MFRALIFNIIILFTSIFVISCLQPNDPLVLGDKISYPTKLLALDDKRFLMLNSDAASQYKTGSIHRYSTRDSEAPELEHVFSIPNHGSDLAISKDNKLLALSFDGGKEETEIVFFDYSNKDEPLELNSLSLKFAEGGGKQSIKQLNFFTINTKDQKFENDYFLYGVILNSALDTGKGSHIPDRTFVARVKSDLSEAEILFVLSYGVGDDQFAQMLSPKSNSLKPYFDDQSQYMIGTSAPVFDEKHNYFIAFPTGSMNGFNNDTINQIPELPFDTNQNGTKKQSTLKYFSGRDGSNLNCENDQNCIQPDLRAVSVYVVDMVDFLENHKKNFNASLYFAPLAWNMNGIPYNHDIKKGSPLTLGSDDSKDSNSFTFQYDFWSSYSLNDGSVLVAKKGSNGKEEEEGGNENEVMRISGFDTMFDYIETTKSKFPIETSDASDFKSIAKRQIYDSYNVLNEGKSLKNGNPLVPYMYARANSASFVKAPTAVYGFDIVCEDPSNESSCSPYWVRSSYLGLGAQGRDSSWLTLASEQESYKKGDNPTFPDADHDPTKFNTFTLSALSGANVCTTLQKKDIYCASFLTGKLTKANMTHKEIKGISF